MNLNFRDLTVYDGKYIENVFYDSPCKFGWEYDFVTLWCWNTLFKNNTQIAFIEDGAVIKTDFEGKTVFFPPYAITDEAFALAMEGIKNYCALAGEKMNIRGLSVCDIKYFSEDKYNIFSTENHADYIYSVEELINLTGKKFHAKRNFVNRFMQNYSYTFEDLTEGDIPGIKALFDKWEKNTVHEKFHAEKRAIMLAITDREALKVKFGILKAEGVIVGFSAVSVPNRLVSHYVFEKADTDYAGAYQTLCKLTAEKFLAGTKYVNRQEDMGIEGLRRAKQSYNPVMMIKKFDVEEK